VSNSISEWIERHDNPDNPLIPAATVLLLRDGPSGIETLMMRRNSQLSFAEGMWVFPGGKIDPQDHPLGNDDPDGAAANAAVREAKEEADLEIDPGSLVYLSHWLPPVQAPKRFSTWFYVAPAPPGQVTVDRGEIVDHAWWRPVDALARAADRRIEILPPTWMSLHELSQFHNVHDALQTVRERGPRTYATRGLKTSEGLAAAWEGDAGYETGDATLSGPRYRLVMTEGPWRLEQGP